MSFTIIVSAYAAIVSTVVGGFSIYKEFRGPRLRFKARVDWSNNSGWSTPNEALVFLTITNTGHRTISLTDVVPLDFAEREGRVFTPVGLPATLAPGESTTVIADVAIGGEGWKRLEIEDSTGRRHAIDTATHAEMKAQARPIRAWQEKILATK